MDSLESHSIPTLDFHSFTSSTCPSRACGCFESIIISNNLYPHHNHTHPIICRPDRHTSYLFIPNKKKNYIRHPKKGILNTFEHISDYVRYIFYRTTLHYVFVDRNALPANRRNCAHGIVLFASSLHTLSVNLECYHGSFLCYAPTSSQKHPDSTAEKQQTSTRNSGSACPSGDRIQQEPNTHCGYQRAHCFRH